MGFRACARKDDPFTTKVRDTYGANVVAAPRAGIEPLETLAVQDDRTEPRGHLRHLLDGEGDLPAITSAAAVGLAGTRSAEVGAKLGAELSAKFLTALGVPVPGASVEATLWHGASGFTFEVRDVVEHQVDLAALGQAINGRTLARTPATEIFLEDRTQELVLITRTLASSSFAVRATGQGGQGVSVAVDGLADLVGAADASLTWERQHDDWVSFTGPEPVTFAFAVVPCLIQADLRLAFGLTRKNLTMAPAAVGAAPTPRPAIDRAGLLTFD
ncbi:gasdermin [Nocardioides mangrovi]|uniref:Gasdermin bGSDM n=1 Tax=Nocardioides mangrovi TaxID=2874580 RepID=A0ABS7UGW8_9ACTN|nr:hypothetical protein [Nocardioides mangrovi]MBZ5740289.1 hypothetical protein [Nocardioides mangrovi]